MTREWLTDEVEVPRRLLDALTSDKLVIFAGAGISIPAPTRLPGFEELARTLAANAGYPHDLDDPTKIDSFLGKVQDYSEANVHGMAEEILALGGRRGNRIHRALARLSSVANLRIVTTNFDPYLSKAMQRLRLKNREFVGPALPLGESFDGLVYLHGRLPLAHGQSIVLTDRDFGEAYVTNGWATRFLTRMFSSYTVLFVGYSGTDTVMRYLTRSLPALENQHFAFVPAHEADQWQGLGITVVPFPTERNFAALPEALEAWVRNLGLTHRDHVSRVADVVARGFPISPLDESFLSSAFTRIETLQHFLRAANPTIWLDWCQKRGDLDALWSESVGRDSQETYAWAEWACRSIAGPDPLLLFRTIHARGGRMSEALWWSIWRALVSDYPETALAGPYLSVLLSEAQSGRRFELSLLLAEAAGSDRVGALRLLEWAVRPVAHFEKDIFSLRDDDYNVRMDFELNGDQHHARVGWEKLQPLSYEESASLTLSCLSHLSSASQASRHFKGRRSDPISASRSAIERHGQDRYSDSFRLLIDVARDSLRAQAQRGQQKFLPVLIWILQSESQTIKRLALDAVVDYGGMDANSAIAMLIDHKLLFAYELKHEVFRLLKHSYAAASEDTKEVLLQESLNGLGGHATQPSEYERYNLLVWLSRCDPAHSSTTVALATIQEANPGFAPRESPDLDSFFVEGPDWVKKERPAPTGRLSNALPGAIIEHVNEHEGRPSEDWLQELAAAATSSLGWTSELMLALSEQKVWAEDVWDVLTHALVTHPSSADPCQILELLAGHPSRARYLHDISILLGDAWSSKKDHDKGELQRQLSAVFRLWKSAADLPVPHDDGTAGLYQRAISSPRGRLALHFLEGMGVLARIDKDESVLSSEVRASLELMIGTEKDEETLTVLAASTGWFLAEDDQWAKEHLLPFFDWTRSEAEAKAVWSGFLARGSWSSRSVEHLSERVRTGYPWMSRHLPNEMKAFLNHHSFLYTSGLLPPEESFWADALIISATLDDRIEWIDSISQRFRDSTPGPELWSRLVGFWSRRTRGTPTTLHESEANALLQWLLLPGASLTEILPILLHSPVPRGTESEIRIDFNYNKLPISRFPRESGRVIARVLRGCTTGAWVGRDIGNVAMKLARLGATAEAMLIVDELLRLGVAGAVEWADTIRDGFPE